MILDIKQINENAMTGMMITPRNIEAEQVQELAKKRSKITRSKRRIATVVCKFYRNLIHYI